MSDLIPVGFFESRFDVEMELHSSKFYSVKSAKDTGWWDNPEYLNGDSVYYSTIEASLQWDCLNGNDIKARYVFCDDKLYGIFIECQYETTELNSCLKDYVSISSLFKTHLPWHFDVNVKDFETKEKIGEAWKYYRTAIEQEDSHYTTGRVEYTRVLEGYQLTVSYKNFDDVKIDNRGFIVG